MAAEERTVIEEKLAISPVEDQQETTDDCDLDEVSQDAVDFETCEECGQFMNSDDMVLDEDSGNYYCEECYENKFSECENCGKMFHSDDMEEFDGCTYCVECIGEVATVCDRCGNRMSFDDAYSVGEDYLCCDCADDHTSVCADCGERYYNDYMTCVEDEMVCDTCVSESGRYCECGVCGNMYREDNMTYDDDEDRYICNSCGETRDARAICNYHQGPGLVFYGHGGYHIGVELEVDGGNRDDRRESAIKVKETLNNHVYCCNDSSLTTGFEIISHPHTYDELISLPWRQAFSELVSAGWRGHDVDTAGLHIHIGRKCFNDDDAIARFCLFFENNWSFIRKFSRRHDDKLKQWASRYFDDEHPDKKFTAEEVKDKTKYERERYRAVNLRNSRTVEVRVFKSTLRVETFLASIELVKLVAERCNEITDEQAVIMSISEWLAGASDNLVQYAKKKGYVIEPVSVQEYDEGSEEVA